MRRQMVTRYAGGLGLMALMAVLPLSGCTTDSPTPRGSTSAAGTSTPTSSSGTTSSASPTTSEAATGTATSDANIPEAARAQTGEGAVAFANYFLNQANAAYTGNAPELISKLSTDSCKTCSSMKDSLTVWAQKNYTYQGAFITPTYVTVAAFPNDGTAKVLFVSDTKPSKLVDAKGSLIEAFPAEKATSSVDLTYTGSSWTVTEIRAAS